METIYEKEYLTASKPGAYSGRETFIRELKKRHKNINRADVISWLEQRDAYTLHRPMRRKFKRNRVIVNGLDDTFQTDLIDLPSLSQANDSFRYILVVIDCFSKYVWARALKSKSSDSVLSAIKNIFESGRIPNRIQSDAGSEFINSHVKQYFNKLKIKLYILNSEMKASIVER
jgi:transposase InsO family protein